ncbi:alpha/beta fold hydrolase [Winogradskyella psychrotolerans]|uniref:alpha/beta fold hydrolase n=1 Tax=Winogradskyella psychrotolerans TaxID=1344585 RepID=UPI001C076C10|nr:alpha/beta hydrolase [Winogradskyella psychrotolerans]MBU2928189.1 alpha/beta hydrolase [Winogradskyella psychrotolerans]
MILNYKNSRIHYTVEGQGNTIVLLHGFLESVAMWQDLVADFSKNNQVICIDLLGHGQTDCIGYIHTMETMADAVLAVIDHLNIEKAHVVGHSMGGYVALALAEKQPELFNGLCLMNSTYEADDTARQLIRTRASEMAQQNYEVLVKMSFANLFAPESKATYNVAYEKALQLALQTPLQGYIAAQEGMKLRPHRFDIFKSLNCKKLIIIGKKDRLIASEQILEQIKDTDIAFVEFSEGHMSYIENKSDLSYSLLRFIEK